MRKNVKHLYVVAVVFFLMAAAMVYQGYDKLTNYYNSSYGVLNVNAYVGGDAYNYIINGTYTIAYFVLTSGFMISGILCIIGGMIISMIDEKDCSCNSIVDQNPTEIVFENENLPSL